MRRALVLLFFGLALSFFVGAQAVFSEEETSAPAEQAETAEQVESATAPVGIRVVTPEEAQQMNEEREAAMAAGEVDHPELGKFTVSGYRTLKYRDYSANGDEASFRSNNGLLFSNQNVEQSSFIMLHGDLPRNITVDGTFSELPYQDRTLTLDIAGNNGRAKLGDFSTYFPGDKLVTFSKNIRGVDFLYDYEGLKLNAVMSKEKSKTETKSFKGQNRRGPYNLGTFSVVEGSVQVKVDGVTKQNMVDYSVDYFRGDITFNENVDSSQIVEVTYESELLLGIKTGSMNAFGAEYTTKDKRFTVGASTMSEGTNSLTDPVEVENSLNFVVDITNIGVEQSLRSNLMKEDYALLKKNEEEVYTASATPLIKDIDYDIDYLNGTITFLNNGGKFTTSGATVTVYYTFYNPKYVSGSENEEIRETGGAVFNLGKRTIYSGSEVVEKCSVDSYNGELSSACEILEPCDGGSTGPDLTCYTIYEEENQLTLNKALESGYGLRLDYLFVQRISPDELAVERKVNDVYFKTKLFGALALEGEMSQSDSDVSNRTIPVLEEYVVTVASSTVRTYCLDHDPEPNTIEIFFDDLLAINNKQTYPTDYTIEDDDGNACPGRDYAIVFKHDIDVGTTIIANYRYKPDLQGDIARSGDAYRGKMNFDGKRVKLTGEVLSKDAEFSPLNDFNNMEESRINAGVEVKLFDGMKLFGDYLTYDSMHDFDSADKDEYEQSGLGFSYTKGRFKEFSYKRTDFESTDNLNVTETDNKKTLDEIVVRYDLMGEDRFVLDAKYSNSDFEDNTGRLSSKETDKKHLGFSYSPSEKLDLRTYYEINEMDSIAPAGFSSNSSFSATTNVRALDVNYYPDEIWGLSGSLLLQNKEDDREGYANERWDSARLGVAANPFGKFTYVQLSFYRKDLPNDYSGSTKTDTANASFGYKFAPLWVAEPSYDRVKSTIGTVSSSNSDGFGFNLMYNPDRVKNYDASARYKRTERDSSNESGSTSTSEDQYVFNAGYYPSEKWNYITQYEHRSVSSGSDETKIFKGEVKYRLSEKLASDLSYLRTDRSNSLRQEYVLETTYKLSRVFDVVLNIERQKYNVANSDTSDYSGTLVEMELTANF
ncbi:MAG TPA: hypothetical protein PLN69_02050 [bacterium]|nr:hypothetical protein [bacterium]